MPRPPMLETIDWPAVFAAGVSFEDWIARDESPEKCRAMVAATDALTLDSVTRGALAGLSKTVRVVAIAEDWCGDVVRHTPALIAMERAASKIEVRFITRAQFPEVFVRYLTNGGEAIPKYVFLSEDFVEAGNWGPMPAAHREWIARGKACGDVGSARKRVSALYDADPNLTSTVSELRALIEIAATESV